MATTALDLITKAFQEIGVYGAGETPNANDAEDAFTRLNWMLLSWTLQPQTIPVIAREVFDLVSGKGGPGDPYTIGDGGDFNTDRPPYIDAVGLVQNYGTSTEVEIPRGVFTNDAWEGNQVKQMPNAMFTNLFYQPTYSDGLGSIYLWPIPNTTQYKIALYLPKQITQFADQYTSYTLPPGLDEALLYNLAQRLQKPYGRPSDPDVRRMALSTLANYKRGNLKLSDLAVDQALTSNNRHSYNINTGTGG